MGGSNVKALREERGSKTASTADKEERGVSNSSDDDDVDLQINDVVSKLKYKHLTTKVDVKGAIGREGDVIVIRPDPLGSRREKSKKKNHNAILDMEIDGNIFLDENEQDGERGEEYAHLKVSCRRSQLQEYTLPPYVAVGIEARVPSRMFVSVSKELTSRDGSAAARDSIATGVGLKEDKTSKPSFTPAPPSSTASFTASPTHRRYVPESNIPPTNNEFSIKTFLEKYTANLAGKHISPHITPTFRQQEDDGVEEDEDEEITRTRTQSSAVSAVSRPASREEVGIPVSLVDRGRFSNPTSNPARRAAQVENGELEKQQQQKQQQQQQQRESACPIPDAVLIRNLLNIHAEAVGLPVYRAEAGGHSDSDVEDSDGDRGDSNTLYLSDDSSTDELYQKSLLQQSAVKKTKKNDRGTSFRLMNDDDFEDDDDDDYESESDCGEYESDDDDSEEDESDDDVDMENDGKDLLQEDSVEVISSGISMNMKDLLQFSCSFMDVESSPALHVAEQNATISCKKSGGIGHQKTLRPHNLNNEGSVFLSDDEDDVESYNKRIEKNERVAQQLSASSRASVML